MTALSSPSSQITAQGAAIGAIAAATIALALGASPFVTGVLLLGAVALLAAAMWGTRCLSARLRAAYDTLLQLQRGNFESRLNDVTERGLLGELLWSVNDFADRSDSFVREAQASLTAVTNGLYYRRVLETGLHGAFRAGAAVINTATIAMERKIQEFGGATARFESTAAEVVRSLDSASEDLRQTALSLNQVATATNERSVAVAAASEQTSGSLRTVVSSTDELSASIGEINRQVHRSAEVAQNVANQTEKASQEVDGLVAAASKIGEVIALIKEIAAQTNLLALNATIEAARAGESGKGFAVVASEVKSLARQTANASDDIIAQVNAIQASVTSVASMMHETRDVIVQMNQATTTIASAMEQQSAATMEIAKNVDQAATGATDVTGNIGEVRRATDETESSARNLVGSVESLKRQSGTLARELSGFLAELRQVV
ncbi:MAG TPA: methyl-accepting chemotaxis protein [Dongiaceae bacterium]|nr:methyl-accepting chemotaxis protein [Dongiaceae bacterium]